jgi:amino acid adenylation domain-containing protein
MDTPPSIAFIHRVFEAHAAHAPEAPAAACGDDTLRYDALNAAANRLAHHLRAAGIGPDALVGVCVQRSLHLPIAVLSVLKAGGAYVPLDPAYPEERLAWMLSDARPEIVLIDAASAPALQRAIARLDGFAPRLLALDDPAPAWADAPADNPDPVAVGLRPEHLAWVIYTSGSTGRPKGAMVPHAGVDNLLLAQSERFAVSRDSRVLQFASFSFDACAFEWVMAFGHGACLCLAEAGAVLAGEPLAALIARHGVTHAVLPPVALSSLPASETLPSVEVLVSAGEALVPALMRRFARGRRLYNAYGPTEATIWSTVHLCDPDDPSPSVPIGRPIRGAVVHLLDAELRAVAEGEVGELCIGGIGVARGYLDRPELTAERFVISPQFPGERLYRSGDLARRLPDGTLQYHGRNDHQVKVRGHRIELGEIEARLTQIAGVEEAVVEALRGEGTVELVAYHRGGAIAPDALRRALAEVLPEYMVPAAYVRIARWPQTPNGKIDRRALPPPADADRPHAAYVAPQGPIEDALARIWCEVLGSERVGRDDAFMQIGGDSLTIIQLAPRIRSVFRREVGAGELFGAQRLWQMAELIAGRPELSVEERQGDAFDDWTCEAAPERWPLSYQQHGLWLLEQISHTSLAYNAQNVIRIRGTIDRDALQRALDAVVERHEIFRTTFHVDEQNEPYQRIHPAAPGILRFVDPPEGIDEAGIAALVDAQVAQAFDLSVLPLLRLTLIRVAADEHVLIHVEHHYVHDGWSANLFMRELLALYAGDVLGTPAILPPVPAQYREYALWQRSAPGQARFARLAAHWRQRLAGAALALPMPTDYPRPASPSYRGRQLRFELPLPLARAVRRFAREEGTTVYAAMHAIYQIVLRAYTGCDDLVIGSAVANRKSAKAEGMLGMFVNMVPVRVDASGAPSYRTLVSRAVGALADAFEHEEAPFELVVRETLSERTSQRNPLFQTAFSFHNSEIPALRWPGFEMSMFEAYSNNTSKFDFDVVLVPRGAEHFESITMLWNFATDLFAIETIERLRDSYVHALEQCMADPEIRIDRLSLLDARARAAAIDGGFERVDIGQPRCLHRIFEAHAARAPEAVAVVDDARSLDYAGLNAAANRLARHLRALGIGPGGVLGVCARRTLALPLSILATLKAGGAYLPLDPDYPSDRLGFMVADARPQAILTDAASRDALAAAFAAAGLVPDVDVAILAVDADDAPWAMLPAHDLSPEDAPATPTDPAYVIYTSGSTGRPKGVVVPHAGAAHLLAAQTRLFDVDADSRVLQFSSLSFDACVFEWVMAFGHGASLHLAGSTDRLLGEALETLVAERGITHALLPPVVLSTMPADARLASIRVLVSGGEAMPQALVERWGRGRRLFNAYGPTEDSVVSTVHACDPDARPATSVPIGRPLPNHRALVLDPAGEPVPPGAAGELYVGGVGVAQGYLRRPELTAERFLDSRFHPGERLYRTGDLVRWRPDGTLEYLGRNDFQVKVRGFRIELGEIETVLRAQSGVEDAVVLARRDREDAPPTLVAYVLGSGAPEAAELRRALAAALPDYMVPSAFVRMEAWPLTPNGKIDRRALPAPEADAFAEVHVHVPPRNDIERTLAALWAEALRIEPIGALDNFFLRGGYSILGVRMLMRINAEFGLKLTLRTLFEHPTVEGMAAAIAAAAGGGGGDDSVSTKIPRTARDGTPIPASPAQQRLWFLSQTADASAAYHVNLRMAMDGPLDVAALRWSLQRLLARHESLRTAFAVRDGELCQEIADADIPFPLREVALDPATTDADAAARAVLETEAAAAFDMATAPLARACLVRLGPTRHALGLTLHHAVFDGWSKGVIARDLERLYAARLRGEDDPLSAPPVQYADYTLWQRRHLDDARTAQEMAFWRACLDGAPSLLELPADRPRPPVQDYRGGRFECAIDPALTARLRALAHGAGATLYMAVTAGLCATLARLSGQHDIVIGTPSANRDGGELADAVGFYINTLALRLRLRGDEDAPALVGGVRGALLDALAHQALPFDKVVEAVNPRRSQAYSPIFQVMLAWQGEEVDTFALDGLQVTRIEVPLSASKFDLTFNMTEVDGGVSVKIEYAAALFDADTVSRHAGCLLQVLRGMAQTPERAVLELPLLDAGQTRQLVSEWNRTEAPIPPVCLHAPIEAQAQRTPEAVAVHHGDSTLTYAELERRANRLAHHLRALGVGPDQRVGLCLPRTEALPVAMLAVLKAGGAYVPLDPAYPASRLAGMLEDARPLAILTQGAAASALAAALAEARMDDAGVRVLDLVADAAQWRDAADVPIAPEEIGLTPAHLAYLIYTSGSTGRPKGVAIEHRNAVNLVAWALRAFDAGELANVLFATSINFDLSVFECFVPLSAGGAVTVVENALSLLERPQPVSLINTVPSAMEALLSAGPLPESVRVINLAGEELKRSLGERILADPVPRRLCNLYGPSETTTYSTGVSMRPETGFATHIGGPLANTRLYVLDAGGRPQPIGVPGELYIGGAGVARGYHDRPELTAERFLLDPFVDAPGARMYRTGDLVRWRADGQLEYLGRNDFQVKLHGFRIELGEIESHLAALPGVREAVVLARPDPSGQMRLVAYCLGDAAPDERALREGLRRRVPEYMVPSAFVFLRAWPLNANGKVDRRALPEPDAPGRDEARVPPRTALEEAIAAIWCELLHLERVGVHDDFFDLGGHSLLAIKVMTRLRERIALELPVQALFAARTIAALAADAERDGFRLRPAQAAAPQPEPAHPDLWFL